MSESLPPPPGYLAGEWDIDAAHSEIGFSVRHMMVSKIRGRFRGFSGEIVTGVSPEGSTAACEIDLRSIDTGMALRDDHVRSADFLDVDSNPTMSFRSTRVYPTGHGWAVNGELTLRGVARIVCLRVTSNGFGPDAYGGTRAGFTATGELNRRDFGVSWDSYFAGGSVVVGDRVAINLEIEAVLRG